MEKYKQIKCFYFIYFEKISLYSEDLVEHNVDQAGLELGRYQPPSTFQVLRLSRCRD